MASQNRLGATCIVVNDVSTWLEVTTVVHHYALASQISLRLK
jgi:hypothetical protein